jgi:hypothetical protein
MADHVSTLLQKFDTHFRDWVRTACQEWNYPTPSDQYYIEVYERLPAGLRALLGLGLSKGLIIPTGRVFTLKGLPPEKGPYNWFSHNRNPKPAPNWEYFVQVAEYIRLHAITNVGNWLVTFEDDDMDIAPYQDNRLFVCYEVKERLSQIQKLIKGIEAYHSYVDLSAPDRHDDQLRKAKYIVKRKPEYFVGVAIGGRFEYKVIYAQERSFQLIRDVVPLL